MPHTWAFHKITNWSRRRLAPWAKFKIHSILVKYLQRFVSVSLVKVDLLKVD